MAMKNPLKGSFHIKHQGKELEKIIPELQKKRKKFAKEIQRLALQASQKAGTIIEQHRRRPRSSRRKSLADYFLSGDAVKIELAGDDLNIFIGNKAKLNSEYKHWSVLNYGAMGGKGGTPYVPLMTTNRKTYGYFGDSFGRPTSQGRWSGKEAWHTATGKGFFLMTPKKPIRAVNYIQKTQNWMAGKWKTKLLSLFK